MPSPFPGMDPYLEDPEIWSGFHTHLATAIRELLAPQVGPGYWVDIERHVFLSAEPGEPEPRFRPDVTVERLGPAAPAVRRAPAGAAGAIAVEAEFEEPFEQPYLVIRRRGRKRDVVTIIELASPGNKAGKDRAEYLAKRSEVLRTRTSLVEIDLLRAGERFPVAQGSPRSDYAAYVFRGWERPRGWAYAWNLLEPIPDIAIPLLQQDGEVMLPLRRAIDLTYDRGAYARALDYAAQPEPPLVGDQAVWAAGLLQKTGLRPG